MAETFRKSYRLARASYGEAILMLRRMWRVLLIIAVIAATASFVQAVFYVLVQNPIGAALYSSLTLIGTIYFTAPYSVALLTSIHEGRTVPAREFVGSDRAKLLFAWSGMLVLVMTLLDLVMLVSLPSGTATPPKPGTMVIGLVIQLVQLALAIRLFPMSAAVAIEGRAMTLQRVLQMTKHRFWLIVGAFFSVLLPVISSILFTYIINRIDFIQVSQLAKALMLLAILASLFASAMALIALSVVVYQDFTSREPE